MLSLASYEKDGRGKSRKVWGKTIMSPHVLLSAFMRTVQSRICKLYSDYSMPKSIHTVAMRRKVNKHYPQRK